MTMTRKAVVLAMTGGAMLTLAGCGAKSDDTSAGASQSVQDRESEAAKIERPRAGQYTQTIETTEMHLPGIPADREARLQSTLKPKINSFCVTEERAQKGYQEMFDALRQTDQRCNFTQFNVSGGKLSATLDCSPGKGASSITTMSGTVSENGSDLTTRTVMKSTDKPDGEIRMGMHIKTERTGDCPAAK